MSKVTIVAHPESGKLFTPAKKEGWVKCQVISEEVTVNNGLITLNKRVAFPTVNAKIAESGAFKTLKDGDAFPIQGKIVRITTMSPQYEGHAEAVNPSTGELLGYYINYKFSANMAENDVDERTARSSVSSIEAALGSL